MRFEKFGALRQSLKAKAENAFGSAMAKVGAGAGFAFIASQSHAAIDVTSVTTGIAEISTAVLAVLGAMLAVSVAVLGLGKVYAFVKRRAGA